MWKDSLNIYKNKRVLVTGHTGFKGSWLISMLKILGANVFGYSLKQNTQPSLYKLIDKKNILTNEIIDDVRNRMELEKCIKEYKPEIVFHLAAQPLVRRAYKDPIETYDVNVMGTLNLYEAIRKSDSVKAIVCITTDKCYENKELNYGYRECDPMGGYDPYSSSKACVEILSSSYRRSYFNDKSILLATARAGNVIGGGDWAEDRLIPDFIRSVYDNTKVQIRNPKAVRPWQHVLEPLTGYLLLGSKLLEGDSSYATAWNFGPRDSEVYNVSEVLDLSISELGKGAYEVDNSNQPHEASILKLNIDKAINKLNWQPKYDVKMSIKKTIVWYKSYYDKNADMNEVTQKQIKEYLSID